MGPASRPRKASRPMSRRRDVLDLLSELERQRIGDAASRRGRLDARLAATEAERGALLTHRVAARDAPSVEALPHLGSFQRAITTEISRCDADGDTLRAELEAVEEEILLRWRWSRTLKAAGRLS